MPIVFTISSLPEYLDLRRNHLLIKFSVTKPDGTALDAGQEVGFTNQLASSFIKQLKIFINNKIVYNSNDTYMYRCFIETLLNSSTEVKKTKKVVAGYFEDNIPAGQTTISHQTNPGYIKRRNLAARSVIFQLIAPLASDITNQHMYILPMVDLRVELYRNEAKVCIESYVEPEEAAGEEEEGGEDEGGDGVDAEGEAAREEERRRRREEINRFDLKIKGIEWKVKKVHVTPSLSMEIEKGLTHKPVNYPIKRNLIRPIHIHQHIQMVHNLLIYNGQIPTILIITFVPADGFHGLFAKSPFEFSNYNLESIQINVNGRRIPQEKPLRMDFEHNLYNEAYYKFLENTGYADDENKTNGITKEAFKSHYFFMAFDLTADQDESSGNVDLLKYGEVRCDLQFGTELAHNIKLLAYMNFDNILRIDKNRNPILDYSL
jgi:hypothetical protein